MSKKKILVFGGTFNPIHNGHLMTIHNVAEQLGILWFWLMPNKIPPHKEEEIDPIHKRRMMELVSWNDPVLNVSYYEMDKEGTSYTIETVKELNKTYEVYWLIGPDIITEMYKWHEIDELAKMCKFVVACNTDAGMGIIPRMLSTPTIDPKVRELIGLSPLKPGADRGPFDNSWYTLQEPWKSHDFYRYLDYDVVRVPHIDIRASNIRDRRKKGLSIKYMVPDYIEKYMIENKLYKD